MASSPLLKQPAFNPGYKEESKPEEVAIDVETNNTDMFLAFDELIGAIREQSKPTKRLYTRIADAVLWRIFQIVVAILTTVVVCAVLYSMYTYVYKEEVDRIIDLVAGYFADLANMINSLITVINKIHEVVTMLDARAANASRVAYHELQQDDDPVDAFFLAIN